MQCNWLLSFTILTILLANCTSRTPKTEIINIPIETEQNTCIPTNEICDGIDNNCDGVIDEGCTSQPATNLNGLCSNNQLLCNQDNQCIEAYDNYLPTNELCDNLDNDCDGVIDNGCDSDLDEHCDAQKIIIGSPNICPQSPAGLGDDCNDNDPDVWGRCAICRDLDADGAFANCDQYILHTQDCDDTDYRRSPLNTEICYDSIDNNCDETIDELCPPYTVSLTTSGSTISLHPNETRHFSALIQHSVPVTNAALSVAATSGCNSSDINTALSNNGDNYDITIIVANDTVDSCTYSVTLGADGNGVDASLSLIINNDAPEIIQVSNARLVGQDWYVLAIADSQITLAVTAADIDGNSWDFSWTDNDNLLICTGSGTCNTTDTTLERSVTAVIPAANPTPHLITVSVSDGAKIDTANIYIISENCVWATNGGSGNGSGSDASNTMGPLINALNKAWNDGTNICILGSDDFRGPFVLNPQQHSNPPHHPSIFGFVNATTPATTPLATLQSSNIVTNTEPTLTFSSGYNGTISGLNIVSQNASAGAVYNSGSTVLLSNCTLQSIAADAATVRGLYVTGTTAIPAQLQMRGGTITVTGGALLNAARVEATETNGANLVLDGLESISAQNCTNECLAVAIVDNASATIQHIKKISASGSSTSNTTTQAIGINMTTVNGGRPSASILANDEISASGSADVSAAIRIDHSDNTIIADNDAIITNQEAGRLLCAGIIDASYDNVSRLAVTAGNSYNLQIINNHLIADMAFNMPSSGGPLVAVGLLLYGTNTASIVNNGKSASSYGFGAITGGPTTALNSNITSDPLHATGLWLINNSGAVVNNNEIRAGYYITSGSDTSADIVAIAFRDTTELSTSSGNQVGTLFDANGVSCVLPTLTASTTKIQTNCAAAMIDTPTTISAPLLTNNVFLSNRGQHLIALWQNGGTGVAAYHNLFAVSPETALAAPGQLQTAIYLNQINNDGISLVNNIFNIGNSIDESRRLAVLEITSTQESNMARFSHNLMYIAKDDLATSDVPVYVAIGPETSMVTYSAATINQIAGTPNITSNLIVDPFLVEPSANWDYSQTRLSAVSPARNNGASLDNSTSNISQDIEQQTRPSSDGIFDIGPDEVN
ncbi:MAG: putative metal-binding motif-containing protein [Deltaproteobacteria bacterium]|nr:putative metal-binding motif-containing protein [Deltaproteobacteria bacterium]